MSRGLSVLVSAMALAFLASGMASADTFNGHSQQGKRVVLHYGEHRGVPTDCFGESQYYVDGVRVIE